MSLQFNENFFDLIFSSNVIEHIPHNQYIEYIKKIHKILKPGSRFIFGTPNYPYKRIYDIKKSLYALMKLNLHDFTIIYLMTQPILTL